MSKRAKPDIRLRFAEQKNGSRHVERPTRFVVLYLNQFGVVNVAAQTPGSMIGFLNRRIRKKLLSAGFDADARYFQSGVWFEDSPPGEG